MAIFNSPEHPRDRGKFANKPVPATDAKPRAAKPMGIKVTGGRKPATSDHSFKKLDTIKRGIK